MDPRPAKKCWPPKLHGTHAIPFVLQLRNGTHLVAVQSGELAEVIDRRLAAVELSAYRDVGSRRVELIKLWLCVLTSGFQILDHMRSFRLLSCSTVIAVSATVLFARPTLAAAPTLPTLGFASVAEGRKLQVSNDAWKAQLTPLARKIIGLSNKPVSARELDQKLADLTRAWTPEEIATQNANRNKAQQIVQQMGLRFKLPASVTFVKNDAALNSGSPYIRGSVVYSPRPLEPSELIHELWHIESRANHDKLKGIYALVGYTPCSVKLSSLGRDLRDVVLTNPDTEVFGDYCVTLDNGKGTQTKYTPLLFGVDPFDGDLHPSLVEVSSGGNTAVVKNGVTSIRPMFADDTAPQYFAAIGGNGLGEPIHPDEIVASSLAGKADIVSGEQKRNDPKNERNTNRQLLDKLVKAVSALK
jgi:hypothetical protein